jgi:hypothetical protein
MTTRWLILALGLVACGDARGTSGFDEDAGADTGAPAVDTGVPPVDTGNPGFDAGNPSFDAGPPPPMDAGNPGFDAGNPLPPTDAGNPLPPTDTGNPLPPTDTGNPLPPRDTGNGGVCPPSCQTAADCNPCRSPGDPAGSNYCCMSGLCLFMSGTCAPPPVDAGNPVPTDVDLNFGDLGDSGF